MPKSIKIRAQAKINLCLDVLKKTPSGWHRIQTIFQEIPEIYDEIEIRAAKNSDNLSMIFTPKTLVTKSAIQKNEIQQNLLGNPSTNLAFLALKLLKKNYKKQLVEKFASIKIKKNIPISSGLGGASSDAAAVLKGLNKLWNLKIPRRKLLILAAKLGKDVPFFIIGGTAIGTNFGEKITPLPPLKNIKFKIFPKPTYRPGRSAAAIFKTKHAYASLDLSRCGKNSNKTKALIKLLKNKKISKKQLQKSLLANLHNDFQTLKIYKNLPSTHHLSGSGPSTFTLQ